MPAPPRRRPPVPDAWLRPPGPQDAALRRRWRDLPPDTQRELARRSTTPADAAGPDADLVRSLAVRRVRTAGRAAAGAALVGWLVLMTVWGFGRSACPACEGDFLLAGLVAGAAVAVVGVRRARRRARAARRVVAALGQDAG